MKPKGVKNLRRTCLLGALNGLSAGGAAQTLYWSYRLYESRNRTALGGVYINIASPMPWWTMPALGLVSFALGSFLVHKLLARRIQSDLLFWQCIGVVSVLCGISLEVALTALYSINREYFLAQLGNIFSFLYLPVYLSAFAFVACINLLYGWLIPKYVHS